MQYPKAIENLKESFLKLPGIGKKTAERLAVFVYSNFSEKDALDMSQSLIDVKKNIHKCPICGALTDKNICDICSDPKRDKSTIMVVENVKDLFVIERLDQYSGVYHVLNGAINFSLGIGIEDLNIDSLIARVKEGEIKEIILSTNATIEGETTARYIKALLDSYDVNITRIAHGLPIGADISYADEVTIIKSLEGRQKY
jgi:recombination protein RecR